jgi:hypothetical protein
MPRSAYINTHFGGTYHPNLQGKISPEQETRVQRVATFITIFVRSLNPTFYDLPRHAMQLRTAKERSAGILYVKCRYI